MALFYRRAVLALLAMALAGVFSVGPPAAQAPPLVEHLPVVPLLAPPSATAAEPANFYYYYRGRPIALARSATESVVRFRDDGGASQRLLAPQLPAGASIRAEIPYGRQRYHVIAMADAAGDEARAGARRLDEEARFLPDVEFSAPVFHYPQSGIRVIPTDEIVVRLRPGGEAREVTAAAALFGLSVVGPLDGAADQFILRLNSASADPLERSRALYESGRFEWAQPNFLQQYRRGSTTNDALIANLWHLENTGGNGATAGADVAAFGAWDAHTGSSAVVIAILDDGVDSSHEDLAANIFQNPGEIPANGLDDDGNGKVDDVSGWDYSNEDNDPNPMVADDNHGTAVAGVAAARGNNNVGVSGMCQACRILPVKIFSPDYAGDVAVANGIYYAGQFADVISNSWGGGAPSALIDSAINWAAGEGRAGKGAVVLFSSGNGATGYGLYGISGIPAGTHRFRFAYTKDADGIAGGSDTAWLGWVGFPGGELASFEGGLPAGWTTGGHAVWTAVNDATHADEGACFTHAARAGAVAAGESTHLEVVKTVPAGTLSVQRWVSSQENRDGLTVSIDVGNDGSIDFTGSLQSGVPAVVSAVSYPASHPGSIAVGASSSNDCRSAYSQFGPNLHFVAPSSGGPLNLPITTTDRTGAAGYDGAGHYTSTFGGTSSAAPLAAGIAALVLSKNPALTRASVLAILQQSADDVGPAAYVDGRNERYGHGRLNAQQALSSTPAGGDEPVVTSQPESVVVRAGGLGAFTAAASGSPAPAVQWQWSSGADGPWTDVPGATSATFQLTATAADHGARFRAVFTNTNGLAQSSVATLSVRSNGGPDFNGDGKADIAVYRPATGAWIVHALLYEEFGAPSDVPTPGDFDGDGDTDIAVYRRATATWLVRGQFARRLGEPGDVPVPADYDGDGDTDLAVYRPSTGQWVVEHQFTTQLGGPGYDPVVGDYDGDGRADPAVYFPATSTWFVRDQPGVQFGAPNDSPVPADYDGNGVTDMAVFREVGGLWVIRDQGTVQWGDPGDVPVARDYDGNGTADVAVFRRSTGLWYVRGQTIAQAGQAGDVPVPGPPPPVRSTPGDFDGDGVTDLAVYRPSSGMWYVRGLGGWPFGDAGDLPVPADYNGDAGWDVAVFRPGTGMWFVRQQFGVQFGDPSDVPVPGDYDGNDTADIAIYRPSTGVWYVRNVMAVQFGDTGDVPVAGDYNGDGVTDLGVYRPSTGQWFIRNVLYASFGDSGDVPVPADYNGDGRVDLAVYRPSTGQWFVRGQFSVQFGDAGDVPVPADYNGDGSVDVAVYRPSTGTWFVRHQFAVQFGDPGDVPVVR